MNLENSIVEVSRSFSRIVADNNPNQAKTILYGSGEAAKKLYPYLQSDGIKIDHIVIDQKYLREDSVFYDRQVEAFEKIVSINDDYIVIVALGDENLNIENRLSKYPNILHILKFDYCIFYPGYEFTRQFVDQNMQHFETLSSLLKDQKSKDTLGAYLNQRISGDMKYLRGLKTECQYYPNEIFHFSNEDTYIDCGAYTGDTILELFAHMNRKYGRYFKKTIAFEPDKKNFEKLLKLCLDIPNFECHNTGVWSFSGELKFSENGYLNSSFSENGKITVPVAAIDNLVFDDIPSFVKMDIEGSELEALKGAKKTISKHKPKLAICVYHKREDLIEIPKYILSLRSDYRLYLRAHHYDSEEVVLYAI
jgi:FkbM family methyltransferase